MDRPIIIKNVLKNDLFFLLNETLHKHSRWRFNNLSYDGGTPSWGYDRDMDSELIFYKAASIIKLKVQRYIRKNIRLCKIHCNGQTSGQISEFHRDFEYNDAWTFVLFTECDWNTQWGGEFVSQHIDSKEYFYTPYIPNTGALIPAIWDHYGQSPNMNTHNIRTTMAFSYIEENLFHVNVRDETEAFLRYT